MDAGSKITGDDVRALSPEWLRYFDDGVPTPEFLNRLDDVIVFHYLEPKDVRAIAAMSAVPLASAW